MAKVLVVSTALKDGHDRFITNFLYLFEKDHQVEILHEQKDYKIKDDDANEKLEKHFAEFDPDAIIMSTVSVCPRDLRSRLYKYLINFDPNVLVCEYQPTERNNPHSFPFTIDPDHYVDTSENQKKDDIFYKVSEFIQRQYEKKFRGRMGFE
ncbi:MAG: hypothetical protein NT120_02715 [Candidatus Aenigmarchaeota archaeon]|nr:hypothetical protein [Candidatus Aenigmarchaeota archaeon]